MSVDPRARRLLAMTSAFRLRPAIRYRLATLPPSCVRDRGHGGYRSASGTRLLHAVRPSILRALTAERADAYVTLLGEMLAARRSGVLAPTLDELRQQLLGGVEDEPAFLRDLLQLEEWGCLTRELEPQCIRGYRDARRDRFRHRLTDDAAALLEWLEARLTQRVVPLRVDADDRLLDVLHRARELVHLTRGPTLVDGADARRALHLIRSIDGELDAIARSLVDLHADMRRFAKRSFEPRALERLIAGLEAYVVGFVGSVGERRRDLRDALTRLARTDSVATADGATDRVEQADPLERLTAWARESQEDEPRGPSEPGPLGELAGSVIRWSRFLEDGGDLDAHCAQVEAAAHDVIATLRGRMATLERRGDRAHELACAIRALAAIDERCEGTLFAWGFGAPTWAPGTGARLMPPLPRQKTRPHPEEPRPLPRKRACRDVAREPNEARVRRVRDWLREKGLTEGAVQLSTRREALGGPEAPAAWMAVARAQHLGRSARLLELGVQIEPRRGVVTLGDDLVGLASPDCIVRRHSAPSDRPSLEARVLGLEAVCLEAVGLEVGRRP